MRCLQFDVDGKRGNVDVEHDPVEEGHCNEQGF